MNSPLDKAHGHEVVWKQIAAVFNCAKRLDGAVFIYFIGEENDGPLKIGLAKDPIKRLRAMQTGNSRRLRLEYVLLGDLPTEKLLHEMWEEYAVKSARTLAGRTRAPGTEWFRPEIRQRIGPIIMETAIAQACFVSRTPGPISSEQMERILRDEHVRQGHIVIGRDEDQFLATAAGYVGPRQSRL